MTTLSISLDTCGAYEREVLAGAAAGAAALRWNVLMQPWSESWSPRHRDRDVGDAAIVGGDSTALVAELRRRRIPVVCVRHGGVPGLSTVGTDQMEIGARAAEHLLERGFRSFAYRGDPAFPASVGRWRGFHAYLRRHGRRAAELPLGWSGRWTWEAEHAATIALLTPLPRPLAVFAFTAHVGRRVLLACRAAGWAVPTEVAVLAGDDDDLVASLSSPALSGIDSAGAAVGAAAVDLLRRLLAGERAPLRTVVPPGRVRARASTDVLAVDDEEVRATLLAMRDTLAGRVDLGRLAARVGLSRRALELRFRRALGRSPLQELRRQRMEQARRLLDAGGGPIAAIARRVGYATAWRFARDFQRAHGCVPSAYRV